MSKKAAAKHTEKPFDPKQHWRSFEHLSLEVLSFVLKSRNQSFEVIDKQVTQKTRDHGVDGYIQFRVSGSCHEYTVEAKLRSGSSISLRDIATSILYFLIGLSDRHFIVTNVIFTAEALRVIEEIRQRTGSALETIDGHELRRLLNKGLTSQEKGVPELIKLLQEQTIPPREVPAPRGTVYYRIIKEHYPVAQRIQLRDRVVSQLNAGQKLFFVQGEPGTGKSHLIWDIAKEAEKHHFEICRVDMSKLYSPRVFILQTLQLILGLNLGDLLDQLDAAERQQLGQDPGLLKCAAAGDYGRAVRYLLTTAEDYPENKNYLLRCLLSELSERCFHQTKGLLIIEGLDNSEQNVIQYFLYVLDILAGERSGLSVIVKLPIFRNRSEAGKVSFEEWNALTDSMERLRIGSQRPYMVRMENFTEYEARDILEKSLPLSQTPMYYENAILSKVGTNPRALFSIIFLIKAQNLFTLYDIERLPPDCSGSVQSAYISTFLEDKKTGAYFRLALAVLLELEGNLPLALNARLEAEYAVQPGMLITTGVIVETPTALQVESRQVLESVRRVLDMGTLQAARKWLLKNLTCAGWKEPYKSGLKLLLKLRLRTHVSETLLESTLSKLNKEGLCTEAEKLLLEAYRAQKEQQLLPALDYLLRYLDRPRLQDKLNTPEYQELLSEADRIAASLAAADTALPKVSTIKLYFLHYWQCKSQYDYDGCIRYTDEILKTEAESLGSKENSVLEKYWIKAHTFRALNLKEQGNRRGCVRAFRDALRRYPQSRELRISCYMNLAAFAYHSAPWAAERFLSQALSIAELQKNNGGGRWLWLYNDRILSKLFAGTGDLDMIQKAREKADKQYSLSNLARTFAFEGCWYYDRGELGTAETFFSKAIQVGVTQGGNKPSFLFLTNVIAIKLLTGKDAALELTQAHQWLMNHFDTVKEKIVHNQRRKTDHLFAAVVSWVCSVQQMKQTDIETSFRRRWEESSDLPYDIFQTANVHKDFLRQGTIIVLF